MAFRETSEDARTVVGEYEPISVVGSSVYELARAEADLDELKHELRAAEEADRRRQGEFRSRKSPLVKRLAEALDGASKVSAELAALEQEEVAACGGTCSFLAWPELGEETPTEPSRLATWLRYVTAEGYL